MEGWVSPLLGIRFERGSGTDPGLYEPSGRRFVGYVEVRRALEAALASPFRPTGACWRAGARTRR
jgi:hypothetical protein